MEGEGLGNFGMWSVQQPLYVIMPVIG